MFPRVQPGFRFSTRRLALATFVAATCAAAGCDDTQPLPPPLDASAMPDAGCMVELSDPPTEGANHVTTCSAVQWGTNPPSSGMHYPSWPVFRAYDKPVPWGFLVHGLEHGAVVLAYNCPTGCAAEIAAAKEVMAATTPRSCGSPPVILTPDPTLSVRFSASSWGHILRASCFDKSAFAAFINAHINLGPELIANDCGVLDQETQGWCP
jgi:hypothetical protein